MDQALGAFAAEGFAPRTWSSNPCYEYAVHEHDFAKVLICVRGSITFHTPQGDLLLGTGDRLDLPAGTPHSATVGPDGVVCIEAAR